ncbi:MAG: AAA family ATPase [Sphingopyxis sp.]
MLFCDLVDSTRIAAQMEPEQYAELLSHLRGLTQSIITRHGGQIARIDGDGALCLFGYPDAYEDAGRRATEAALDLHDAVANLHGNFGLAQQALRLHSGIHAGVVLLRSGDIVRGRYEILGDATNVAARLCDAAQPGTILVSAGTLGSDRHFFVADPQRSLSLSGHQETIQTLTITGRSAVPHRFAARTSGGLTPFVGRKVQRKQALNWLSDKDASHVLLVSGPAGIGKSRLIGQIGEEARAEGWQVLCGYCEAYLGTVALQPFNQICAALPRPTDPAPTEDRAQLLPLLVASMKQGPMLLVIDDWQWRDDSSRNLLTTLLDTVQRDNSERLRIMLTSREADPGLPPENAWTCLALEPFDEHDVRDAVATMLPAAEPSLMARIMTASGGSPLLIEELCHAFAAGRAEPETAPRGAWFDLAVQDRLAHISSEDANVLHCAAVIGNIVPVSLLTAALDQPIQEAMLDHLQAADFLFRSDNAGTLRFKHGLTRDAVYAATGRQQRLGLHRRVAAALSDSITRSGDLSDAGLLARHLAASEQQAAALPWWLKAGDAALGIGALDRAQFHYSAAFDWLDRDDLDDQDLAALRHVIRRFGRACVIDPSREHETMLDRMLRRADIAGDGEAQALSTYWIGAHYYGLGEPRKSLAALNRAMNVAKPLASPSFLVQIQANLGQTSAIAGHYDAALSHMGNAIDAKSKASEAGRPDSGLAYCLSSRGLVRADIGDFAAAYADFDAAMEALGQADDAILPSLVTQRCLALIYQGRFAEAATSASWSEQRATASRARFLILSARALGSYAHWLEAGSKTWFNRFAETVLTLHHSARFQRISYKYGWMAEAMAERGEATMTQAFATLSFQRTLKGDRMGEASAARALALLSVNGGTKRPFDHYLHVARRAAQIRQSPREHALNSMCSARCLAAAGRNAEAKIEADLAAQAFARLGMDQWTERIFKNFRRA